jgi:hypothetical protein
MIGIVQSQRIRTRGNGVRQSDTLLRVGDANRVKVVIVDEGAKRIDDVIVVINHQYGFTLLGALTYIGARE